MSTQAAVIGNATKNNGATVLKAGNIDGSNVTYDLTLARNAYTRTVFGGKAQLSSGATGSSGNLGTAQPISAGAFNKMEEGEYVATIIGDRIAQTDNTVLRSAANAPVRHAIHRWPGYQRLHITSWDYVTGIATEGAYAGLTLLPSGVDGVTGMLTDEAVNPTNTKPGELVYLQGGLIPKQDDYKPRTN